MKLGQLLHIAIVIGAVAESLLLPSSSHQSACSSTGREARDTAAGRCVRARQFQPEKLLSAWRGFYRVGLMRQCELFNALRRLRLTAPYADDAKAHRPST